MGVASEDNQMHANPQAHSVYKTTATTLPMHSI